MNPEKKFEVKFRHDDESAEFNSVMKQYQVIGAMKVWIDNGDLPDNLSISIIKDDN